MYPVQYKNYTVIGLVFLFNTRDAGGDSAPGRLTYPLPPQEVTGGGGAVAPSQVSRSTSLISAVSVPPTPVLHCPGARPSRTSPRGTRSNPGVRQSHFGAFIAQLGPDGRHSHSTGPGGPRHPVSMESRPGASRERLLENRSPRVWPPSS